MIAYAVTDPSTLDFTRLEQTLENFSQHASMIVYRDTHNADYAMFARRFLSASFSLNKKFDKVLLHSDYGLAHTLHADGVHLKSTQLADIKHAKDMGLFVVVSTHSVEEALEAESLGADMLTISPVFQTPNKGMPIGHEGLEKVTSIIHIPVIALGGILTQEQIDACEKAGAKGFASIRYFGL